MTQSREKKAKVAVIGVKGMLGHVVSEYYRREGYRVIEISRREFDIIKQGVEELEKLISGVELVINCTGVVKPRIESVSVEEVLMVNAVFPRELARLCSELGIKCVHISTDCVFSGGKGGYKESDYVDVEDLYGLSKAAGDTSLCMTLRTSVIGEELRNKYLLLEWVRRQRGKQVSGYINHRWNGVTSVYLAELIEKIFREGLYKEGVFHIFSRQIVTKYELLKMIDGVYDLGLKVVKVETEKAIDRSLDSEYGLAGKIADKSLQTQIKEMREFFRR